jgi:hypothetical protein
MSYRSPAPRLPTPRLPAINDEPVRMRSSSPVLSVPIVIPPIIIPDVPTDKVRPCAPYARPVIHTVMIEPEVYSSPKAQEEPPSRIPNCMCGYTKILLGFVTCPIVCSASCLAGTAYTMYNAIRCNCADKDALKYRDTFCTYYGCGTAYTTSYRVIESGLRDIRPTVQQNMFR